MQGFNRAQRFARGEVVVPNGLLTVELAFGASAFNGEARWLEIGMRTSGGSGDFTTLRPRQPVTATPYALHAVPAGRLFAAAAQTFAGLVDFNPVSLWLS
jgi:hypothetical protein